MFPQNKFLLKRRVLNNFLLNTQSSFLNNTIEDIESNAVILGGTSKVNSIANTNAQKTDTTTSAPIWGATNTTAIVKDNVITGFTDNAGIYVRPAYTVTHNVVKGNNPDIEFQGTGAQVSFNVYSSWNGTKAGNYNVDYQGNLR